MKIPTSIALKFSGSDRLSAHWEDDTHRFHIWFDLEGQPLTSRYARYPVVIYKNPIVEPPRYGRRTAAQLDGTAAANAQAVAAVVAFVNVEGRIREAIRLYGVAEKAKEDAKYAQRAENMHRALLTVFTPPELERLTRDDFLAIRSALSARELAGNST